jgi:hypothetical protein
MMALSAANCAFPFNVLALLVFSVCGVGSIVSARPFCFWARAAEEEEVNVVEELDPVRTMGVWPPGGTLCCRVVVLPMAVATRSGGGGGIVTSPGLEAMRNFCLTYSDQYTAVAWVQAELVSSSNGNAVADDAAGAEIAAGTVGGAVAGAAGGAGAGAAGGAVGQDGAVKVDVEGLATVLFALMALSLAVREADLDLSTAAASAPRSGFAISALRAAMAKALLAALKTAAMTLVEDSFPCVTEMSALMAFTSEGLGALAMMASAGGRGERGRPWTGPAGTGSASDLGAGRSTPWRPRCWTRQRKRGPWRSQGARGPLQLLLLGCRDGVLVGGRGSLH